jgi:hypothetical protein
LGTRLRVVALIDPNPEQSRKVLELKRQSSVELGYRDTLEFATLDDYLGHAKVWFTDSARGDGRLSPIAGKSG